MKWFVFPFVILVAGVLGVLGQSSSTSLQEVSDVQSFEEGPEVIEDRSAVEPVSEPAAPVVELESQHDSDSDFSKSELAAAVDMEKVPLSEVQGTLDLGTSFEEEDDKEDVDSKIGDIESQISQLEGSDSEFDAVSNEDSRDESSTYSQDAPEETPDNEESKANDQSDSSQLSSTEIQADELAVAAQIAQEEAKVEEVQLGATPEEIVAAAKAEVDAAQNFKVVDELSADDIQQENIETSQLSEQDNTPQLQDITPEYAASIIAEAETAQEDQADSLKVEEDPATNDAVSLDQSKVDEVPQADDNGQEFEETLGEIAELDQADKELKLMEEKVDDVRKADDDVSQLNELAEMRVDEAPSEGAPAEERVMFESAEQIDNF